MVYSPLLLPLLTHSLHPLCLLLCRMRALQLIVTRRLPLSLALAIRRRVAMPHLRPWLPF